MNWNGNFEQSIACLITQTSVKAEGADMRFGFNGLMLDAYGIEYKSYSPVFHRIPLS